MRTGSDRGITYESARRSSTRGQSARHTDQNRKFDYFCCGLSRPDPGPGDGLIDAMNGVNFSSSSLSGEAQADAYSVDESMYRQFRPEGRDVVQLPRAVVYLLMAAMVVVGVAYAIIGHLIKDLAIDITECVLGPTGDEEDQKMTNPQHMCASYPPPLHPFPHNAFHVWDRDDVVIPLPPDESPQTSPLLLAALPYIPSFFPQSYSSPTCHGSPALYGGSPGQTHQEIGIPRDM